MTYPQGAQDSQEPIFNSDREISADEGVSVTYETVKEDIADGLRKRKESSKSDKETVVQKDYEGSYRLI